MKERITVTIDKNLLSWLDKKIDEKYFANRSHGLEFLVKRQIQKEDEQIPRQ
jgi:metal-responsive CopG/Arc/MetJ family transcriptional regulator